MVRLLLDINKSIEENASDYFEKAKKLKKKVVGAEQALRQNIKKLIDLEKKRDFLDLEQRKIDQIKDREKEWFEKFRWFKSSEGFLVIGGRDATSNEVVIKKHTDTNDLVFHTDLAGSPFFVIKSEGKEIPKKTIQEVADATSTFSRVWKLGLLTTDVFYVKPIQVSKKTKAGEYMGKGAFMIYGKTTYVDNKVNLAIGLNDKNVIMAGPVEAIKKNCKKFEELKQGSEKVSSIAKRINHKLGRGLNLDEIIRALPAGGFKLA
jgi:predicted ribosome quality control (RQC) complex YloA/Tae2 family protein